ncbi:unnamed protein product, partial [Cuscuta campestris]
MAIVILRIPREYVSVPGHAKTTHDFMLVNEEVHAESCLFAGAWRCFQQNGNFNASTDQQNGKFTIMYVGLFIFDFGRWDETPSPRYLLGRAEPATVWKIILQ